SFAEITVDGLDGNQTFTLPNTSGTVCLDSNNCGFALAADIDNPTSTVINNLAGTVSIQGTTNQINVATAGNAVVLSLPQSLATTSSPTFNSITLTGTGLQNGNVLCDISNNCGYAGGTNSFVQGGNSF